jgi:hypothetical protein
MWLDRLNKSKAMSVRVHPTSTVKGLKAGQTSEYRLPYELAYRGRAKTIAPLR